MNLDRRDLLRTLTRNRALYLMVLPGLVLFFLVHYLPMFGVIVAFKDFSIRDGILRSPWAQPLLYNFEYFFTSGYAWRITRNTIFLNLLFLAVGLVLEVTMSLILNELRNASLKKSIQSIIFLPHFMSWIVVSVIVYSLLNYDYGAVNALIVRLGGERVDWYLRGEFWPGILLALHVWKATGFGVIVYLAVISGFDSQVFEAAEIDGANRWHKIRHISVPMLVPTMIILTLLRMGRIMNADFGMFYAVVGENPFLYPYVDVIDTFVFRSLRRLGDMSMASAAAFYQSVIAFVLVLFTNWLVRRYDPEYALF